MSIALWHTAAYVIHNRKKEGVWDYLKEQCSNERASRATRIALFKWLLATAMTQRNPNRLVALYETSKSLFIEYTFKPPVFIAFVESAIWLRRQDIANELLRRTMSVCSKQTTKRLHALYIWRFGKKPERAKTLISPLSSQEAFLPYQGYLACAHVTEEYGDAQDAIAYYKKALELLPPASHEYTIASSRCNWLMNTGTGSG